jgi:thiosulfate/3-mercaptopyruvate sulfurtransferase
VLLSLFRAHDVDLSRPVVTSCGSGVTAAIASLALAVVGAKKSALYDGSWAEWGARPDAAIEA